MASAPLLRKLILCIMVMSRLAGHADRRLSRADLHDHRACPGRGAMPGSQARPTPVFTQNGPAGMDP